MVSEPKGSAWNSTAPERAGRARFVAGTAVREPPWLPLVLTTPPPLATARQYVAPRSGMFTVDAEGFTTTTPLE